MLPELDGRPELQGRSDVKRAVTFRTTQRWGHFDYGNGAKSDVAPVGDAPAAPPRPSAWRVHGAHREGAQAAGDTDTLKRAS